MNLKLCAILLVILLIDPEFFFGLMMIGMFLWFCWYCLYIIYSLITKFRKRIIVNDKFDMRQIDTNDGSFLVSDMDNNVYKISSSFWYFRWNLTETWSKIRKGEIYDIEYYGFRSGFLNMYPIITRVECVMMVE